MSSLMDMDPTKRDELVKDYVATFKRIQKRNLEDRLGGLHRQRDLEVQFQPVVKSQEKMTKAITSSLIPLRERVLNLKDEDEDEEENDEDEDEELPHKRPRLNEDYKSDGYGPLAREFKIKLLMRDPDVDTSFGIYFSEDGHTKMGSKIVKIVGDNLIVDNDVYTGSKGLWTLITGVTKNQIGNINEKYNEADLYQYIKLLRQTSALHQDFDPENSHPRSNRSWKWKNLLKNIWDEVNKQENEAHEEDEINSTDNDGHEEENENQRKDDAENVVRDIENFLEQREQSGSGLKQNLELIRGGSLYVHKNGLCCSVSKLGKGLYLSPHPPIVDGLGDGLYVKTGATVYDGHGLLFGPNNIRKKNPMLEVLL